MFYNVCKALIFKTAFETPGHMKEMTDKNVAFCNIGPMLPIY